MFMHLSCQCPFKRGFEVNANIIIFFFFFGTSTSGDGHSLLSTFSKISVFSRFLGFFQVWIHGTWIWSGLQKIAFVTSIKCRFAFIPSTLPRLYRFRRRTLRFYRIFCFICRIFCSNSNSAFWYFSIQVLLPLVTFNIYIQDSNWLKFFTRL